MSLFGFNGEYLTFNSAPNYENPRDIGRDNEYDIILVAEDNGSPPKSSSLAITITVTNVNERPGVDEQIANQTLTEGGGSRSVNLLDKFDDEDGDTLEYSANSSQTTVATVSRTGSILTPEGVGDATVTVTARDRGA